MTKITMKALDTMHMSNVQADNLLAGDKFDVSEAEAKILEDRGLAARVGAKAENKSMAAPEIKPLSADTTPTRSRKASAPASR